MSNRFIIFVGLALGLFWIYSSSRPSRDNEPREIEQTVKQIEATPAPAGTAMPVAVRKPEVAKAGPVKVIDKPSLPAEPFAGKMELVHFKVEDGLAVTFGDVILGVPVSEGPIEEGYNKPSAPKPWVRPEIAYVIHPDLKNPERVENAISQLRESTVVNFVPLTNQKDAIVFEPGEQNCKSYLGRIGGHQPIKLSDICGTNEVLHEIMHALGFIHEQSRTDRDQFVEVNWKNVQDEFKPQFAMVTEDLMGPVRAFGFDYKSIMLYPPNMFAERTSEPTLMSKTSEPVAPSDRGLSQSDIVRINKLFR